MKRPYLGFVLLMIFLSSGTVQGNEHFRKMSAGKSNLTGTLKGVVQCISGGPVAGANVTAQDGFYSTISDNTGVFTLQLPVGIYAITVSIDSGVRKTIDNVTVVKHKKTDLGILSVLCEQTCSVNDTCMPGSYCAKAAGDCSGQGTCSAKPAMCTGLYDPVCGCDGKTYGNDCEAAAAGVNVVSKGACFVLPPPPVACSDGTQCAASEYCAKAAGDCPGQGTCSAKPAMCTGLYDPVCGCDGKTYGNDCEAAMAGVNVVSKGACIVLPPPPVACSDGTQCAATEYCAKTAGNCSATGTCEAVPELCILVYDPVCGCDGRTYGNACEAAMARVNVMSKGACIVPPPPPVACSDGIQCAASEYCAKTTGDCSGQGTCSGRPELCTAVYDPVCGCNGETYGNDCEAARAGVNVVSKGTCIVQPPPPLACSDGTQCAASEYCQKAAGGCSAQGTCAPLPAFCTQVYDPVCGCDGKTYANDCEASLARVSVAAKGACITPPPPSTVCLDGSQCASTEYCSKAEGLCGGEGTCAARPSMCTTLYDPVCGCDGTTYSNDCQAAAAGESVVYKGACTTVPPVNGCLLNSDCSYLEYCSKAKGDCNGTGTCQKRPDMCILIFDPVFGCDGNTYGNSCEAARAGVNVL